MMENKTSRQVFADFYGGQQPRQNSIEAQAVESTRRIDLESNGLVADFELNVIGSFGDLAELLQGFPCLLSQVLIGAKKLMDTIEEQVAARELSQKFGEPVSLLALPVAMKLASKEAMSKTDSRRSADSLFSYSQAIKEWLNNFELILKLQLIALEEEMVDHLQAKNQVVQVDVVESSVSQIKTKFVARFERKQQSDDRQRLLLENAVYWTKSRKELLLDELSAIKPILVQPTTPSLVM